MDAAPRPRDPDRGDDPLSQVCARLAEFAFGRRRAVLAASAAVFVSLAVAASGLRLAPDWAEPFLPESDAALTSYAAALHRFGRTESLYVDVSAPDAGTLQGAADLAELRMRESRLFARVTGRLTEQDLRRTAEAVGASVPSLLDAESLERLAARTEPDAISARMEDHHERLLGPLGGPFQAALARDPLELTAMVLEDAAGGGPGGRSDGGARAGGGRIVSEDGRHVLVLGVTAARVGDGPAGEAIESFFAALSGEMALRGAALVWVGGHRHYRANSEASRRDVMRVSLVAAALVLGVIFAGFRGARITWISGVAVAVGAVAGAAALRIVYGECSGIAVGIGAALSGISVDYVIHLHAARRCGERRAQAVRRVFAAVAPSVVIGAVTSAAGFLVLLASDVPAHGQLGVAAGAGIGAALLFALLPGPLLAAAGRRDEPAAAPDPPNAFDRCSVALFGGVLRRPVLAFTAGAALVAAGAAAAPFLEFEPDLQLLQVRDAPVDRAQAAIAATWGDVFAQQLVVVPGPDVETVLVRTDAVAAALRPLAGREYTRLESTSTLVPSAATQRLRFAAWGRFWSPDRRIRLRADLAASAAEVGIRPATFDPFLESLDAAPATLLPEGLDGTPLQPVVDRHLSVRPGDVLGLMVVSGAGGNAAGTATTWPGLVRDAVPEARVMSSRGLADAVVAATRREFAQLALPALALVWLLLLAYYRSAALATIGVFPLAGGLLVAAGLLVVAGARLTLLSGAVALPVFGLGVDYSIFLMDAIRAAAREVPGGAVGAAAARGERVGLRMGTVIGDVLTTLAGAGAMLLAATPALHSIGLAMTVGVAGAAVVAWLMVPLAMQWASPAPERAAS